MTAIQFFHEWQGTGHCKARRVKGELKAENKGPGVAILFGQNSGKAGKSVEMDRAGHYCREITGL
jgi:hypothetical protein